MGWFFGLGTQTIRDIQYEFCSEHLEKQDDSSKWKNIPEDELMSYVEEIEDDIIFYPEEAPVFSLYGCKKVTAKVRARLLDDDEL